MTFLLSMILKKWEVGNRKSEKRPEMAAAETIGVIKLDGILDEPDWEKAPINDQFKTTVPIEGGVPSGRTQVRVLAHPRFLVIGVQCFDNDPKAIVNYSKLRDVELEIKP